MKFTTYKNDLNTAINNIIKAVSTKNVVPALEGILIKTQDGQIELTAYDLELGMKTTVSANILEAGSIIISAKLLSEIIRKAPNELISVTIDQKFNIKIESGESKFDIIGFPSDEFPELPAVSTEEKITIPGELLKGMIKQTIFAIADTDVKPINQGSLFNFENGTFDLVSVDGFRLAVRREQLNINTNTSFVVPGKTLQEVFKLADENDVEIFASRRHIMFKINNCTIISSILEGEFIDYKNILPKQEGNTVTIKTRDIINSTERVSLVTNDKLKSPVRCKFYEDMLEISCTTALGRAKDTCPCKMNGNFIEIGFNNKYLLDAFKNTECDEIKINITGSINPMLITPTEGDSFMFLVLPVRLKDESKI